MYCPECGVSNSNSAKYCQSCGTSLELVNRESSVNLPVPGQEHHPWLKMFTIMGIPLGLLVFIFGFGAFDEMQPLIGRIGASLLWLVGAFIIYACIRTLKRTDYFRYWRVGLKKSDKYYAYFAITLGVYMTIALIFVVPVMRLVTDLVGGGGSRRR